jgi:hypothetical protein
MFSKSFDFYYILWKKSVSDSSSALLNEMSEAGVAPEEQEIRT